MAFSKSGAERAVANLSSHVNLSSGRTNGVFLGEVTALGNLAGDHGGETCDELLADMNSHAKTIAETQKDEMNCRANGCSETEMHSLAEVVRINTAAMEDAIRVSCKMQCDYTRSWLCAEKGYPYG